MGSPNLTLPGGRRDSVVGDILNSPGGKELQATLISALLAALIAGITGAIKKITGGGGAPKPAPPVAPIVTPQPIPGAPDDFPDDFIPAPKLVNRTVTRVGLHLGRAQYSRQRFPEMYTDDNPFGLVGNLRGIEAGEEALPWGSKFWLDLTARDQNDKEFLRDAIVAGGLAFRTEHHCGDAFIKGHGAQPDGNATPGYETNDTNEIGNGISAWLSSNGFLHQMKAHGEGEFECRGSVGGVESNHFKIRVS